MTVSIGANPAWIDTLRRHFDMYAHREDSPFHSFAERRIAELAEGAAPWAIPWPCMHEFLSIVTNPRTYRLPTPLELACDQVEVWMESPNIVMLAESEGYWPLLSSLVVSGKVAGPHIHDAHIFALCRHHGVRELWSADRDFNRFRGIAVVNPLIG